MLCLEAGKNVLCEKAFTVNAAQARALADKAKEKNLFLMEAVWTRYFPLSVYVREQITSGRIGPLHRVLADNSMALNPEQSFSDGKHRMVNPDLAGGALLDLGIYSLTWVFQTLYHTQPESARQKPKVLAALKTYGQTKAADETSTIVLSFPRPEELGGEAHAVATTSLRVATAPGQNVDTASIRIQGPKGEIQVFPLHSDPHAQGSSFRMERSRRRPGNSQDPAKAAAGTTVSVEERTLRARVTVCSGKLMRQLLLFSRAERRASTRVLRKA